MSDDLRYWLTFRDWPNGDSGGRYQIFRGDEYDSERQTVLWERTYDPEEDLGEYDWPADLRAEWERITGKPEFAPGVSRSGPNVVELFDPPSVNQPCRFGHLVEDHAVYCHNEGWLYAPRKCHRTWYTNGARRDEDCPGYEPNLRYKPEAESGEQERA